MSQKENIIIYNTVDGKTNVALYARDGVIWMNQNQIAELFDTSKQNIGLHIKNIFKDWEQREESVVKDYFTTASDGKNYNVTFYSLEMILAIWFRVKSKRGTQFRIWANQNLKEYMVKGFVMDDERLKNPDGRTDYFDELLARIRDIRASEKRFYQKLRDLFSLSSDYDSTDKATEMFFAETQNKLLYAITMQTAAEIIITRADESKPNMALTSWKWAVVRKEDIYTAKNYLTEEEIDKLNRLVTIFLETAEFRLKEEKDITIKFWQENVDKIIELNNKKVLNHRWSISHTTMKEKVSKMYEKFDTKRKKVELIEEDKNDLKALEDIEDRLKLK
ncbi:MAG: hypothetical protein ACD_71C00130G0005 [uncultured bacterium (gcode 4)]|uniref:Uncharacterized protein n=1 Tax=uncultured bacterium (gcode 4) TaxID=1234023 RepID=K1ZJ42_9BACT|nr:MAG: hypothetical protein ACD_71C00130G0005 [uncultured bacterium (gcode 4)]